MRKCRVGFYSDVAVHLNGRFRHLEPEPLEKVKSKRFVTLGAAIKMQLGMDRDISVLAYVNHQELRDAIGEVYATFDELLSEHLVAGTTSEKWSLLADRTESEVVDLLVRADDADPAPAAAKVVAISRPGIQHLLGKGKYRSAIASEVCRLMALTDETFGAVLAVALQPGQRDDELLAELERRRREVAEVDDVSVKGLDLGKLFTKAAGVYFDPTRGVSVVEFCAFVTDDWSAIDDHDLEVRLTEVHQQLSTGAKV